MVCDYGGAYAHATGVLCREYDCKLSMLCRDAHKSNFVSCDCVASDCGVHMPCITPLSNAMQSHSMDTVIPCTTPQSRTMPDTTTTYHV